MSRKDFKKHNTGFKCLKCGAENNPAVKSERNHCAFCLYSLHVDEGMPGDRMSFCGKLMEPTALDKRGNKGFMILHKCVGCGKEMWNRMADDDDLNRVSGLML